MTDATRTHELDITRVHQSDLPEEFATPEAQAGFNSSLDRFAAYLATL